MIDKSTKILPFAPTYHFDGIIFNNWSYYAKDFLATEYQKTRVNHNNLSNIINFKIGKTSFLFTGGAEQALGKAIKKAKPDLFKPIDFLWFGKQSLKKIYGDS
ncbi:hypothetical protein SPE_0616 [Spiroplasma eriocheiris CCTCC M 207170]|nr:hypothetical protein [Spiroplasma eriocheiris]AHF57744.1 hypothetical protein SPE_0616 [Spiroplasma eriocheiris CCTCC M 207170]